MITAARPHPDFVERYRRERLDAQPTFAPGQHSSSGYHRDAVGADLVNGAEVFERGRRALSTWTPHIEAGIQVFPAGAPIEVGSVVALLSRQMGLWVLAACRITEVANEQMKFGFTYATLPDHPERGAESFSVTHHPDTGVIRYDIEATSQPNAALAKVASPIARRLQLRITARYLEAMQRHSTTE